MQEADSSAFGGCVHFKSIGRRCVILPTILTLSWVLLTTAGWASAQGSRPAMLTIEQAVAEAIENNPGLLAERLGLSVAGTAMITAGLRPNPVVSYSNGYLDW